MATKQDILKAVREWQEPRLGWKEFLYGWQYKGKQANTARVMLRSNLNAVYELMIENPHDDKLFHDLCSLTGHGGSVAKGNNYQLWNIFIRLRKYEGALSNGIRSYLDWCLKVQGY